ncbi:hypothetical protein PSTG_07251 [Puccinia striiformis f. sp. tritici PST-78]|uniref:Endonuclease/exonuclease/phosphatase domain-containing protein n=1 Tax=Puccinia striiformis f. sp. tritici PST-78 TaxID=1165861 RepID=A0A0L0VJT5_9BASI|nr:hypothetical protein PSTG_07251 [Puccinia striiformis f. sp. tritici PST-78]
MLKQLLQENNVSVAGVQEHLRTVCQYAPGVKNYNIFERPSEKGFRGHCLYIHTSLAAHEIQSTCKHIIYVKIFGLFGDKPWHIFSVYMPSGNLRRKDRTEVWSHFKALLLPLQKDGESLITLMGDFNQDQDTVSRILDRGNIRCLHLKLTSDPSSNSTRRVHEEEGQYIDHFINSPAALKCASTAKVDNISADLSDHWPIFLNHNTISKDTTRTNKVWNRKLIAGHGMELALSDRWSCLSTDDINTEEDLTNAASKWVEILNATDHYHEPSTSGISGSASVNTAEQPKKKLALQHSLRHHPLTLKGIVKVIPVLQPNRRQRFDIWVKNEVAAGL